MMNTKTTRQKMYVVLAITILFSSLFAVAAGGVTVFHQVGDSIIDGNMQVSGTVSGSNLTETNSYIYSNLTGTPSGVGAYSFLIGKFTNSSYYAVNGTDNQYVVSWTSLNASAVINNCTQQYGKDVLVLDGVYNFNNSQVVVWENTTVRAQSWNTLINVDPASAYRWIFTSVAGVNNGVGNWNATLSRNVHVKGFHVNGNGISGEGIVLENVKDSSIEENWVENFTSTAISVLWHSHNVQVKNNRVENVGGAGIRLEEASGITPSTNLNAINNFVNGSDRGVNIENVYSGQITGNTIINSDYGIAINLDGQGASQQLQVFANNIYNPAYQSTYMGIYVNNTFSSDFISNNVQNCSTIFYAVDSDDLLIDGVIGSNSTYGFQLTNINNSKIGTNNVLDTILKRGVELINSNNNTICGKYTELETSQIDYDAMLFDSTSTYNTISVEINGCQPYTQSAMIIQGDYYWVKGCTIRGVDVGVHLAAGSTYVLISGNNIYSSNGDYFYDQSSSATNIARDNWQNNAYTATGLN